MVASDREHAAALADEVATEHLEVHTAEDGWYLQRLRNYGSIFLGSRATVAFSDKAIGTNHTLPTGHAARYTGGLSVAKFLKTLTYQRIDSDEGVRAVAPARRGDLTRGPHARARGDRRQAPGPRSAPGVGARAAPAARLTRPGRGPDARVGDPARPGERAAAASARRRRRRHPLLRQHPSSRTRRSRSAQRPSTSAGASTAARMIHPIITAAPPTADEHASCI